MLQIKFEELLREAAAANSSAQVSDTTKFNSITKVCTQKILLHSDHYLGIDEMLF